MSSIEELYRFKRVWTSNTIDISICPDLPINQLRNKINEQIVSAFGFGLDT